MLPLKLVKPTLKYFIMKNRDAQKFYKVKSRIQMAAEFGINRRTFYNWLKDYGIELSHRKLVTPKEQKIIYETLGYPFPTENPFLSKGR